MSIVLKVEQREELIFLQESVNLFYNFHVVNQWHVRPSKDSQLLLVYGCCSTVSTTLKQNKIICVMNIITLSFL